MIESKPKSSWWLPCLVCLAGLVATSLAWYVINQEQHRRIEEAVALKTTSALALIEARLDAQYLALVRMAERLRFQSMSREEWERDALAYIRHDSAYWSLCRIGPDRNDPWCLPARLKRISDNLPGIWVGETRWRLVDLENERDGFSVSIPVSQEAAPGEYIVGFFHLQRWLENTVARELGSDFAFSLRTAEGTLYRSDGADPRHERDQGVEATVDYDDFNGVLKVWPQPGYVEQIRASMPHGLILSGGILLSLLVGLLAHLVRTAQVRTRQLTLLEERYRTLVETPDMEFIVMLLDLQGNYLYVSPQIETLSHYVPDEFYADKNIGSQITHPEDLERGREVFARALQGEAIHDVEVRWYRKDGQMRWALESIFPVYERSGQMAMIQVVYLDITERKRVEEQLRESLEEKEMLLKEIHHRVKNNLNVISSLLGLQARVIEDEQARTALHESGTRVQTMSLIHERLYQTESFGQLNADEYFRPLVEELSRSYNVRPDDVALDMDIAPVPLPASVVVCCGLIVNELVTNGFKYAFPDERRGTIRVALRAEAGGRMVLSVADNGVGLPPDLDLQHSKSLGLQLVHTLVRQLDGEISIGVDRGAKFKIVFGIQDRP